MLFKYRAVNAIGQRKIGYMWASDEKAVIEQLGSLRIQPIRIVRVVRIKQQLKTAERIDFLLYLTWMLRAGVVLREALGELALSAQTSKQCQVARQMIEFLDSGLLLSETMALLPAVFNPLAVYYTVVGEKSGELIQQLELFIAALQWQATWQNKLIRVLAYPLFTVCTAMAALLYLFLEVVPALTTFLSTTSTPQVLPSILAFSVWVKVYGLHMINISVSLCFLGYISVKRLPFCRGLWDTLILRLPAVGPLVRDLNLTRMIEVIAHLHGAGFTLLACLYVAHDIVQNQALQKRIIHVAKSMEEGATLSNSFTQSGIFPPILLRAIYSAERSGQVAFALNHAAQFFRDQVKARMRLVEVLVGPVCLLMVGGVLIALVLSVFGPLFDMVGQVY